MTQIIIENYCCPIKTPFPLNHRLRLPINRQVFYGFQKRAPCRTVRAVFLIPRNTCENRFIVLESMINNDLFSPFTGWLSDKQHLWRAYRLLYTASKKGLNAKNKADGLTVHSECWGGRSKEELITGLSQRSTSSKK